MIKDNPLSNIEWVKPDTLKANDYNPNIVYNAELKLLEFSIVTHGWLQPILVTQTGEIIDGYHRYYLALHSENIQKKSQGMVPVVRMTLTEAERKLLTIRINRAKGSHLAFKMAEIIKSLVDDHQISIPQIAKEIGATKDEIDLLLMDNVFKKLDIANHEYSKAWYPKK